MNSQEYRNLQEAYLQVYSLSTLNEFGPGDVGGSLSAKRTFGGAPGTPQNTTVSGSAAVGNSNVSGSLEKGTFSGQGDKTSQGVDNAIRNYETGSNGNTSTSTITTGVRGTLDANYSGKIGSYNPQAAQVRDAKKAEMLRTVASNIKNQQLLQQKKQNDGRPDGGRPDDGKSAGQQETDRARLEKEARNNKYLQDRAALVRAGVTDESGNENPNGRTDLENRLGGKDGAIAGDLLTKLRNVTDTNTAAQLRNSTGVRKIVQKSPGVYGAESFDLFDYMMEYLIDEGYANTNESALVIMANMSEDWRDVILEREDSPYEKASDAALDARYGYGRASGSKHSFGRAANRNSAAAALRALRRGIRSGSGTSREAGADAVHQGWAHTARTNSDQTPAKKERRAKLADTPYSQLPDDEKEKDRVSFDAVRAIYNRNRGR